MTNTETPTYETIVCKDGTRRRVDRTGLEAAYGTAKRQAAGSGLSTNFSRGLAELAEHTLDTTECVLSRNAVRRRLVAAREAKGNQSMLGAWEVNKLQQARVQQRQDRKEERQTLEAQARGRVQ